MDFIWRGTSFDGVDGQLMMEAMLLPGEWLLTVITDADGVESTSSNLMEVRTEAVGDPVGCGRNEGSAIPVSWMRSFDWRARICWLWTIGGPSGVWSTQMRLRATSDVVSDMEVQVH